MAGRTLRAFRGRLLVRIVRAVAAAGRRMSLAAAQRAGRVLGTVAWHVARGERRKALAHIAIAFPEWTESKRRQTIKAMFRHLGTSLFEIVWLPNLDLPHLREVTSFEGLEPLQQLVAAGRSGVAITGHCGNWEWAACSIGMHVPLAALQRERNESGMNEFITSIRAHAGVRTIDRGSISSAREMIQALRQPGLLAFVIDQSLRAESATVPFFGHPALTPIGPAKMAIRAEAFVVTIFIERNADGTHHVVVGEPIETHRGDDPIALTARLTRDIEQQIRRVPEQWVWMHERWRDRPKWDVNAVPRQE